MFTGLQFYFFSVTLIEESTNLLYPLINSISRTQRMVSRKLGLSPSLYGESLSCTYADKKV